MPLLARAYLAQGRFQEVKDISVADLAPAAGRPPAGHQGAGGTGAEGVCAAPETIAEAERLVPTIARRRSPPPASRWSRNDPVDAERRSTAR